MKFFSFCLLLSFFATTVLVRGANVVSRDPPNADAKALKEVKSAEISENAEERAGKSAASSAAKSAKEAFDKQATAAKAAEDSATQKNDAAEVELEKREVDGIAADEKNVVAEAIASSLKDSEGNVTSVKIPSKIASPPSTPLATMEGQGTVDVVEVPPQASAPSGARSSATGSSGGVEASALSPTGGSYAGSPTGGSYASAMAAENAREERELLESEKSGKATILALAKIVRSLSEKATGAKSNFKAVNVEYQELYEKILSTLGTAHSSSLKALDSHEMGNGRGVMKRLTDLERYSATALTFDKDLLRLRKRREESQKIYNDAVRKSDKAALRLKRRVTELIKIAEDAVLSVEKKLKDTESKLTARLERSKSDSTMARQMAQSSNLDDLKAALDTASLSFKAAERTQELKSELLRRKFRAEQFVRDIKSFIGSSTKEGDGKVAQSADAVLSDEAFLKVESLADSAAEAATDSRNALVPKANSPSTAASDSAKNNTAVAGVTTS